MKKNLYAYLLASTLLIAPTASFGVSWFTKTITEVYDHPWTKKFLAVATVGSLGYIWYQQRQHKNDLVNQKSKHAREVQGLRDNHKQELRTANEIVAEKDAEISRHREAQTDLDARNREIWQLKSNACTTGHTLDQQAAEINNQKNALARLHDERLHERAQHASSHASLVLATQNAYNTIARQSEKIAELQANSAHLQSTAAQTLAQKENELSFLKQNLDQTLSLAQKDCNEALTALHSTKIKNRVLQKKVASAQKRVKVLMQLSENVLSNTNAIIRRNTWLTKQNRTLRTELRRSSNQSSFMQATAGTLLATSPAATVSLSPSSGSTPIATQYQIAAVSAKYSSALGLSSSNSSIAELFRESDQNMQDTMKDATELLQMSKENAKQYSELAERMRACNSQLDRDLAQISAHRQSLASSDA